MNSVYIKELVSLLERLDKEQYGAIAEAAAIAAATVEKGGVVHTFGAGHSGSVALEGFHRSGSFAQISAILDPGLMFQQGALAATAFERLEGYTNAVLTKYEMSPEDCLIVISNSGRNPAGIDLALAARGKGLKVIAVTSAAAHKDTPSRHSSGKKLADCADVVIDNLAGKEETELSLFGGVKFGPVSTVTGAAAVNAVFFKAAEISEKKGVRPDIYSSSNNSGDSSNEKLEQKYSGKVKHLK
jgi:uncharacterized phosphosugar-binding protein